MGGEILNSAWLFPEPVVSLLHTQSGELALWGADKDPPPSGLAPAGGYLAHSLAVMTDAAHLLTDFASMLISLFSLWMSSRPATKTMNFGWQRAGEDFGLAGYGVEREGELEQGFLGSYNGWIPHSSPK